VSTLIAGFDATDESAAALAWAGREAVRHGAEVRVAHVWRFQPYDGLDAGDRDTQAGWARDAVDRAVAELAARHPGLRVTADMWEGRAPEVLAEVAAAEDGTLVLGSRGQAAVVGFLVGSVALRVIAETVRPVVLVRADDSAVAEAAGREIVVGQQGTPGDSAPELGFAFEAAAARGASVRVVRAWSLPPVFAYSPASLRLLDEAGGPESFERKALAEAVLPWRERFPDVPVVEHVEMGSAGEVLLSVAGRAQLVVVGRRVRHTSMGARIGSVAHGVLHHAPCPVAVVPPA
jgi:nucleotide-binding universal stress UspA family protein